MTSFPKNILIHSLRSLIAVLALLLMSGIDAFGQEQVGESRYVSIVSYNVENLFDTTHDTLKADSAFLPESTRHWTKDKYLRKVESIARVIVSIGGFQSPAVVGLCEVENETCLKDLLYRGGLKNLGYRYIHHESNDTRGIDCAMLYDPLQFRLLEHRAWRIDGLARPTRDLLYAKGICLDDTLNIILCHLPSQISGREAEERRMVVESVLQQKTDSLIANNQDARIIVMGDMNTTPRNNLSGMSNMMAGKKMNHEGTYRYKGEWSMLDQFYVSQALLPFCDARIFYASWMIETDEQYTGFRPKRTYRGMRYTGGVSDHLPIVLNIYDKEQR